APGDAGDVLGRLWRRGRVGRAAGRRGEVPQTAAPQVEGLEEEDGRRADQRGGGPLPPGRARPIDEHGHRQRATTVSHDPGIHRPKINSTALWKKPRVFATGRDI